MSTRAQILAEIAAQFPDNTTGLITPAKLRQVVEDIANSYSNLTDEPADAAVSAHNTAPDAHADIRTALAGKQDAGNYAGSSTPGGAATTALACTGNAATATALETARTINGVSFDGTANITVPAVDQTARDAAAAAQATANAAETPAGAQAKANAAQAAAEGTAATALSGHVAAADPHGDRAYSVQRANHTGSQAWSTITSTPTTLSGYGITDAQGLDSDLTALAGLSSNGLIARTADGAAATRTITGTTDQITVTNGDGVSGNPTLSLPQSIAKTSTPQFAKMGIGVAADAIFPLFVGGKARMGFSSAGSYVTDLSNTPVSLDLGYGILRAGSVGFSTPFGAGKHGFHYCAAYDGVDARWEFVGGSEARYAASQEFDSATGTFITKVSTNTGENGEPATLVTLQSMSQAGALRLHAYGAGTLVTDSSGNVTALAGQQNVSTTSTPRFAKIGLGADADGTYLLNLNGALVHGTSTGVGIGTSSPAAQLHLRSASDNIAEAIRLDNPTNKSDNGSKIVWRNADVSKDAAFFAARRIGSSNGIALTFGTAEDWSTAAATEKMRIAGNGNVGINKTNPTRKLDVVGDSNGNGIRVTGTTGTVGAFTAEGTSVNIQADSSDATRVLVDAAANASGSVELNGGSSGYIRFATGGTERMRIASDGGIRFNAYGSGTLQTDSAGNVTASSDARLKNVTGDFSRGLADVLKLTPRTYRWNEKSGMNTEDENVGFIAQEVLGAVPEAVGTMKTTDYEEDDAATGKKVRKSKREAAEYLTLSDRPIIAALVNAVKELKAENDTLRARVSALENGKAAK